MQFFQPNMFTALLMSIFYLLIWATFDIEMDKLLWKLYRKKGRKYYKCDRGDVAFKRYWRNTWKILFPAMTTFVMAQLAMFHPIIAFKFFIYSFGFQAGGMEDLLYFVLQKKILPKELPWLPKWINTRNKILINVFGYIFFILTWIEQIAPNQ